MENTEKFEYNYSAQEQAEIRNIRKKYEIKEKSNLEKIKELDASTTKAATIISLAIGIISSLILGTGMCCVMLWGIWVLGIIVGLIGILGICLTYPLYKHIVNKKKDVVKDEILKLCNEMN